MNNLAINASLTPEISLEQSTPLFQYYENNGILDMEGEDVLHWQLKLPTFQGTLRGEKRLEKFYKKVENHWIHHWNHDVYDSACDDLLKKRQHSRVFQPWRVSIFAECTPLSPHLYSISLTSQQKMGKGLTFFDFSTILWDIAQGCPSSPKKLLSTHWNKDWCSQAISLAETKEELQLLPHYPQLISAHFDKNNIFFDKNGLCVFFRQGTIAPWEEGIVKFILLKTENMNFF